MDVIGGSQRLESAPPAGAIGPDRARDGARKRRLLSEWMSAWLAAHGCVVALQGQLIVPDGVLALIDALARGAPDREYVYVLVVERDGESIPVYVGRTGDPVARWRSHLAGLALGRGVYAAWRARLLAADGTAPSTLRLLVVPVSAIGRAPIPGFPVSAGAVEYQLIGLASDANPGRLLNREGNRRG